ncbi:MAG: GNAT family N-acetyltransferase [Bacteroidota bacterium]
MFYLETEHLILRDVLVTDAEDFFKMDAHPDVHRYLGNNPIIKLMQAHDAIKFIRQQYIDNGIGRWATIEKSSGNFIGWSGLKLVTELENKHSHYLDVGYRFHPDYWGKGYATESTNAALRYGFEKLNAKEIIGACHEKNVASRRVLEKCGLKFIEQFNWKNITCDWLKITKEEWSVWVKEPHTC